MARYGDLGTQYFDDAGDPLVSGRIYFYESGTTTPKTTYADVDLSIPNTNPVILTAAGRQPNIFFDGVAKAILATSTGTQILVRDPVGDTANSFGNPWIASKRYTSNDVVQGSDGQYYVSLINGNVNNNPVTTTGNWTFLYSVEWNAGTTYKLGSVVTYQTIVYQSLQNTNLNQNPSTITAYWVPIQLVWSSTATYAINANVVGTDGVLYTSLQNANTGNIPASSPSYWVGTSAAAAASATAAAASAAASAASASTATTQATNAAASASTATTQATNAAASAATATTQASNASTSASNASTSATNAAASAATASTQASNASTSATSAASSATSATASASTATTQASNASTSASNASTSASNASTSETNAAASASTATTQATNASTSASSASTSATNAAASASSASTSATSAAASFDSFDDRYLGAKASDPSVDNDGNPLITGALYWNTTSSDLRVYSGSSWIVSYLPAPGSSGNVLTSNGSTWSSQPAPSGGLEYVVKTANYTVVDKQGVLADTSGGAFTVTLPATPAAGAQVVVADAGASWATNNLTVGRNGSTIGGLAQDLVCDIAGASVQLVYDGSTWEVYAQVGGNGGTAVTLDGVQTLTNKTINLTSNTLVATSAQMAAAVTDETGSGALVFATSPTLVTPVLGTPTSGNLSNCTADGTDQVGFKNIPQNSQSANYTLVLADAGKHIFHPVSDNNARTFTIPAASSVAFPIGTAITFINMAAAACTIAITSDVMNLSSAGTTGSRTLAQYGSATAIKVAGLSSSGIWLISGSGLT